MVPPTWLFFSVCYGRGDQKDVLRKWSGILVAAFAAAFLIMAGFRHSFVSMVTWADAGGAMILSLGAGSTVLHAFLLVGSVMILLRLEQTFRAPWASCDGG